MKLKIFLASLACAAFLFFLSCKQDQNQAVPQQVTSSKRLDFMKGKSFEVIKSDYKVLPEQVQKELWIEKVQQLLSEKLPLAQLTIIKQLESELLKSDCNFKSFVSNAKIQEIGLNLAKITPRGDFIAMFSTLDDYKYKNSFVDNQICNDCIVDMELDIKNNVNSENALKTRLKECNCRWTCGMTGNTTKSCSPTSSGCGFLWMGSCGERNCMSDC